MKILRRKLKSLSQPPLSLTLETYVDLCYQMRGADLDYVKSFVAIPVNDHFGKLAHYVWRLGATRAAANTAVKAFIIVPSLKRVSQIRTVIYSDVAEKTLSPVCISPQGILHGIVPDSAFQNPVQIQHAFERLHDLDAPVTRPLFEKMKQRQTIVTRVHAELQIADKFSRIQDMKFVDNDKYIGCSKPACYFCYKWLDNHEHRYVRPATHHKIIPGCRGADGDLNGNGANVLLAMYTKISRQVGEDIVDFLHRHAQPRRYYMSTEASIQAPSQA